MSAQVVWDNEDKTIVRYIFQGHWGWDDFYNVIEEANAMMDSVDHEVHAIIDTRGSGFTPTDLLSHLRDIHTRINPKAGMHVLVGAKLFVRTTHKLFIKLDPRKGEDFTFAATLDEARAMLAQKDVEYPQ